MASVGEVKALLSAASIKCGEAWGALEQAKEQAGGALAATQEAQNLAGAAFDGSNHPDASLAVSASVQAGTEILALIGRLDAAQDQLLVAQNSAEVYSGRA